MKLEKYRIVKLLSKSFAVEILQALDSEPLRFVDLKEFCPNDRTRSSRLKELKKHGFIIIIVKEIENHGFIHYEITNKGRKALELIEQLERL